MRIFKALAITLFMFVATACADQTVINVPVYQVAPYRIYTPNPVYYGYTPQTLLVPRVQYQPYQYQGSRIWERRYSTPFRNWMFGRYRIDHYYSPQTPR